MRSFDTPTLQQTRAKAAPHVFRLPIVQKICYKVSATTLEHSVQCQRLIIPVGKLSPKLSSKDSQATSPTGRIPKERPISLQDTQPRMTMRPMLQRHAC